MLTLENLTKVYPARPGEYAGGIRDASIELPAGAFFTLLGPSGCRKTTTLRWIAGLETPDVGRILVGGEPLYDADRGISIPLHRRNIGMVFQSYAIWPHMSVYENVAFPMQVSKTRKYAAAEIRTAVGEALESVGLTGYDKRSATQLSGGQQQRVALARAVVHRPKLLLLDEPLSNLDAALREEMRSELKRLQRELGITAVYVTHDQSEALAMSDTIAVIDRGRIVQIGGPRDIYFKPANDFVAGFIGHTNILRGRLADRPARAGVLPVELEEVAASSAAAARGRPRRHRLGAAGGHLACRRKRRRQRRERPAGDGHGRELSRERRPLRGDAKKFAPRLPRGRLARHTLRFRGGRDHALPPREYHRPAEELSLVLRPA